MSREQRIDFQGDTWSAHRQEHWLEFAGNPNFPDYLRIVFVAYARHTANGHAKLERGELARYLVRKDGVLPDRRSVDDSVRRAVALGFLREGSRLLCLVVSSDHVQGGRGDADKPCTRDHTIRTQNVPSHHGRWPANVRDGAGRSETNVRDGDGRSTLTPSISLVTAPPGAGTAELGEVAG